MNKITVTLVVAALIAVVAFDLTRTQEYRDHCAASGLTLSRVVRGEIICK